jgi:hypothetical protein
LESNQGREKEALVRLDSASATVALSEKRRRSERSGGRDEPARRLSGRPYRSRLHDLVVEDGMSSANTGCWLPFLAALAGWAALVGCGASVIKMDDEAKAAWNLRQKTDSMLLCVLPVVKVFIMLCASHGVNADQEIALVLQIMKHLSGREEK